MIKIPIGTHFDLFLLLLNSGGGGENAAGQLQWQAAGECFT